MQRKTLLASAASLLLAGSAAFAFAQDATPKAPAATAAQPTQARDHQGMKWNRGDRDQARGDHGGWGQHGRAGMHKNGVIGDLHALERLYVMSGRAKELPALYNDVLAKSQNPMVRDYAYRHLARAQMQPQNVDAAIATMRKSLDESLAQDQKRHQEMEAFKQRMQQRAATKS
ncbi:hypothetical protein [Luteibacter jiangsuensis]|jgi:hypothetical protein